MRKEERHEQFTDDLIRAGYEVEPYRGRNDFDGPSVRVERDELQDVIRSTKINLRWDSMGKSGLVIYPC